MKPDLSKLHEWKDHLLDARVPSPEDTETSALHKKAQTFLKCFDWCGTITHEYVGMVYPGIVGVFLFEFEPTRKDVDEWVWVIVGDLPPAYITCEESPNAACALDAYVGAMLEWVEAAEKGTSTQHLIPVNVEPTRANAERLRKRLLFLDERILSEYAEALKA